MQSQLMVRKSVRSLIDRLIQLFEYARQPAHQELIKPLNDVWSQIRKTLTGNPELFPPPVLPEIITTNSTTELLIENTNQAKHPLLWLIKELKPLRNYLDGIAVVKKAAQNLRTFPDLDELQLHETEKEAVLLRWKACYFPLFRKNRT